MSEEMERAIKKMVEQVFEYINDLAETVDDAKRVLTHNADDFVIRVDKYGDDIYIKPFIDANMYLREIKVPSLDKIGEYVAKAKWEWLYDMVEHMDYLVDRITVLIVQIRALTKLEDKKEG